MKLTIKRRLAYAWDALTYRLGHSAQAKGLTLFQEGYDYGLKDRMLRDDILHLSAKQEEKVNARIWDHGLTPLQHEDLEAVLIKVALGQPVTPADVETIVTREEIEQWLNQKS